MSQYVTDTHAIVWHIFSDRRLSQTVRAIFEETDLDLHQIFIPSIVLVEITYLAERGRIPTDSLDQLISLLESTPFNYTLVPLDLGVVNALGTVDIPEMPDRIIAATAKHLDLELLTRDETIRASNSVRAIW